MRPVATKPAKSPEPFTVVISASELPRRILDLFPEPPAANARFAVTIEAEASESEKLEVLRRELQAGLDDLAAGKVRDGKEVFAELKKRFPAD
jgi:predicted transcriptional regulator